MGGVALHILVRFASLFLSARCCCLAVYLSSAPPSTHFPTNSPAFTRALYNGSVHIRSARFHTQCELVRKKYIVFLLMKIVWSLDANVLRFPKPRFKANSLICFLTPYGKPHRLVSCWLNGQYMKTNQ